jgi:hypothetical protein
LDPSLTSSLSCSVPSTSVDVLTRRLSRILGHALEALRSPKDLSPAERTFRTMEIESELSQWQHETPAFFHPSTSNEFESFAGFAHIPPIFERQQWRVRSTYSYTRLLIYRPHLLDELLSRLRRTPSPHTAAPSPEMLTCVSAAMHIAETAVTMQGTQSKGSGGMFWTTGSLLSSSSPSTTTDLFLPSLRTQLSAPSPPLRCY